MPLSGLSVATELALGLHHPAPNRRAPADRPNRKSADTSAAGTPREFEDAPGDAAFYAGRFKANLAALNLSPEGLVSAEPPAPADETDQSLFDFFGNLSALLVAVRAGDLTQARAAADALEMEVLVERSAGRPIGEWAAPPPPGDLAGNPRSAAVAASPNAASVYEMLAGILDDEARAP